MQTLTIDKARHLLKELQYAKAATGGHLSMKEEYYKQALEKLLALWEQQERGEGDWIEWGGGECPVAPWEAVSVKHRNDKCTSPDGMACEFDWSNYPSKFDTDIIAYRIIPEQATNQNGEQ